MNTPIEIKDPGIVGAGISKLVTGIGGLDHVGDGGLPRGRTTLVAGSAGSAKTVMAAQFLVQGIAMGEPGVFVTFEEKPEDIRRNMASFGWNIARWESEGTWAFVDVSTDVENERMEVGQYDLGALMARIEHAVRKTGARRVSVDSLGAIFSQLNEANVVRHEIHRICQVLKELEVTAIITSERVEEYGPIARYGVEEFVADNVIILRNILEEEKRRRTLEVLKFRGTTHHKGEFPFTVRPESGMVVMPLSAIELKQKSTMLRVSSGNDELDAMCQGGFFRDSIILVSGATGTGKTLMVTEFINGGAEKGERCLLFAFEESREQLFRNAIGWGVDFEKMEREGKLKVVCEYPEVMALEDHQLRMRRIIDEFKPNRIAVDSLSALERVSTYKGFREFVLGITSFIKHSEMSGLFTSTTPTLMGGTSITEAHISTITDSIILLRYVEILGEMRRGLTVLKMRGSMHDKSIREYVIDNQGMHIRQPFRKLSGILAGHPTQIHEQEIERLDKMFERDPLGPNNGGRG